jgi:hypothetical protein
MTITADRSARRRLLGRVRLAGAVTAAFALAALVAVGPTTRAQADADSYNQMTGSGATASAISVNWTSGLLNAENQPITTAGSELSPNSDRQAFATGAAATSDLSFMYADFKNIQVTVSQTENITHQGITVKWSGANPTQKSTGPKADFMQLMECWGDADTGPSPENCQYGSFGMLGTNAQNTYVGDRAGFTCGTGVVPSTATPPPGAAGDAGWGCDTHEPATDTVSHCDPNATIGTRCQDGFYEIPFVGVDDTANPVYGQQNLLKEFNEFDSNEVQDGITSSGGSGQLQFETLTNVEAPHLGCGALESDGKPRNCWLVIVPRGNFEPNGYTPQGFSVPDGYLDTSPLAASNWAQRIQIHLSYAPLGSACPPTVLPDQVVGTTVASRAVSSWELALNLAANCNTVYAFTATTENEATTAIRAAGPDSGEMALTTIPIGSEATRFTSGTPPSTPGLLYAPVAVTAMDFGFNINVGSGYDTQPVNLTPQLVARALTQVYRTDLPDYVSNNQAFPGPAWSQGNPGNITLDPAFGAVNSTVGGFTLSSFSLAPLLTEDHSQLNQQVWQWVQSDPATTAWLDTASKAADPVHADPDYVSLGLGKTPAQDSFPRAYSGVLDLGTCTTAQGCTKAKDEKLATIDMLPYAPDSGTAAAWVLAASDTSTTAQWSPLNIAPDGTNGWWTKVGVLPAGQAIMWGLSDTPDLAAYGLIDAALCDPTGKTCTVPSIDSVSKTLNAATADSAGLLEINPGKAPAGGYPLVQVVYAAVPTNQSKQSLTDYANLIKYAANQGQTTGSAPGDLPPGYLPLTPKLQAQANAVVKQLQQLVNPTPTATKSSSARPTATTSSARPTSSATTSQATSATTPPPTGTQTQPASGQTATGGITPTVPSTLPALPTSCAATSASATAGATATSTATASATSGGTACGATPTASPSSGALVLPPSSVQLDSGSTQGTVVSNIRLVLVLVLIIGAAGCITGTVLRSDWRPRRRRSRGPT